MPPPKPITWPTRAFGGVHLREFLSDHREWHALVQGATEFWPPWRPRYPDPHPDLAAEIIEEHHYYMFGRTLGILPWLAILIFLLSRVVGLVLTYAGPSHPLP